MKRARFSEEQIISILWVEDGDHSFKPRASSGRTYEQNLAEAIVQMKSFIASLKISPSRR